MAFRAPLLGYNTNVRHKGKLYHIQTEDSGIDHPHVITHLFADGGRIVASKKTSYAERVGSDGLPDQVKKLMQGQHKAMFISLRDGIFDEDAIDQAAEPSTDPRLRKPPEPALRVRPDEADASAFGAREEPLVPPAASRMLDAQAEGSRAATGSVNLDGASVAERTESPVSEPPAELDELDIELQPDPSERPPAERAPLYSSGQPPARLDASAEAPLSQLRARAEDVRAPAPLDGASTAQSGGGPRSLFGGDLLSDKSLDEVILNYLAANEKEG